MSIKYELSLWRDYPGPSSIEEEKIVILAATDMSFGGRAKNIKLKREYNGKVTLTFDLPVKYVDFIDGQEKNNIYISTIRERSKIKLWRDETWWNPFAINHGLDEDTGCTIFEGKWEKGRWYDFIVVSHIEKRNKKQLVYSYTCNSFFMDELSRTGYGLEFVPDTDIMSASGMGTAHDLARRIINGTDWTYIKSEIFPDYKEEYNAVTGTTIKTPVATDQIEFSANLDRYVYCHKLKIGDKTRQNEILNAIEDQGAPAEMYGFDNKGYFWWKSSPNENQKDYIYNYNKTSIITSYADKIMCYTSGEMVKNWSPDISSEDYEFVDEATLLNSTSLWEVGQGLGAIESKIYTSYETGENFYRLVCTTKGNSETCFVNNGNESKSLAAGQILMFNLPIYNGETPSFEIYDYDPAVDDPYNRSRAVVHWDSTNTPNKTVFAFNSSYFIIIPKRISRPHFVLRSQQDFELRGFFLYEFAGANEDIDNTIKQWLSEKGEQINSANNAELMGRIEALPNITIPSLNHFLNNICEINGVTSPIWLPVGTMSQNNYKNGIEQYLVEFYTGGEYKDIYLPLKEGESYKITSFDTDKRRAINGSKSNRYSLLETVSKTFNCFSKFLVEHNEDGTITKDETGKAKKYFTFVSELGRQQFHGFNYGVNLEKVERKVDSSSLVSKVYVENIDNQYTESGVVTIQNSIYNKLGERFFYNFNYYSNQGFLNNEEFKKDYEELVTYVGTRNRELLDLSEQRIKLNTQKEKVETSKNTNQMLMNSLVSEASAELLAINWNGYVEFTESTKMKPFPNIVWSDLTLWNTDNEPINYYYALEGSVKVPDKYNDFETMSMHMAAVIEIKGTTTKFICNGLPANNIRSSLEAINTMQSQYKNYKANYEAELAKLNGSDGNTGFIYQLAELDNKIASLTKDKNNKISSFEKKYHNYILEGQWQGKDYIEPDTFYLDATRAMATACMPKVSYTIGAKDLSRIANPFNPEDENWGIDFVYDTGDTTYIKDEEIFGEVEQYAMVASIESSIDEDKEDKIELRNFETRFEDLFQSIAVAVTTIQLNENIYSRASNFTAEGIIDKAILQKSFDENKNLVISSANNSVVQDKKGLTITDLSGSGDILRAVAGGIFLSDDGGNSFVAGLTAKGMNASLITAGQIDTSKIVIRSTDTPQYVFDGQGLTAYSLFYSTAVLYDSFGNSYSSSINARENSFVRFDQFGLWMTKEGLEFKTDWWKNLTSTKPEDWIIDHTIFSLTRKGLVINSNGANGGTIKLDTETSSFQSLDRDNKLRVRVGYIRNDNGKPIHGVDIYDGAFRLYAKPFNEITNDDASLWFENNFMNIKAQIKGTTTVDTTKFSGDSTNAQRLINTITQRFTGAYFNNFITKDKDKDVYTTYEKYDLNKDGIITLAEAELGLEYAKSSGKIYYDTLFNESNLGGIKIQRYVTSANKTTVTQITDSFGIFEQVNSSSLIVDDASIKYLESVKIGVDKFYCRTAFQVGGGSGGAGASDMNYAFYCSPSTSSAAEHWGQLWGNWTLNGYGIAKTRTSGKEMAEGDPFAITTYVPARDVAHGEVNYAIHTILYDNYNKQILLYGYNDKANPKAITVKVNGSVG